MSQKVNAVPDPSFSVPPLTTVAGTRVSRRRIKVPCNFPGTKYSHNGQASLPNTCQFDIADNESFLDMDKSMIVLDFTPQFHSSAAQAQRYPFSNVGFDDSSQSLFARVRIGNSQGLIIEELQAYGTWANIMDSYSMSDSQRENHLLDFASSQNHAQVDKLDALGVSSSQKRLRSHVTRRLFLRFKHSSFLKSCRMIPLFLMRNGIRFEIEFQNVLLALTRKVSPQWMGPYFAVPQAIDSVNGGNVDAEVVATRRFSDWWLYRDGSRLNLIVRKNSQLALDLNIADRIFAGYNKTVNMNNGAVSTAQLQNSSAFIVTLKIEYTDDLGVDKNLLQGVFTIQPESTHKINQFGNTTQLNQTSTGGLALCAQSLVYTGYTFDTPPSITVADEEVFRLVYEPTPDGFSNPLLNLSGPENRAILPYASGRPRIYVDPRELANRYAETNVTYNGLNDAGAAAGSTTWTYSLTTLGGQPNAANADVANAKWDYQCANIEMICDLVKPSSEVFLQFQQAFQAPAGIPYAYKRVLYYTKIINVADGIQQISLPYSVRSLRGLVCVLSDKAAWSPTSDNTSKIFPSLSAFMKRGLYRAQLVIGGQTYPNYDLNMTELGMEQIPELECLFNVAGLGSFNPSFDVSELMSCHNYLAHSGYNGTSLPFDGGMSLKDVVTTGGKANGGLQEYHDTRKFVLGLSTMKKDGDFVTGVDTSQAGSISLNLYFKSEPDVSNGYPGDSGSKLKRDVFVQVFGIADAVFTLQNDANLVRY